MSVWRASSLNVSISNPNPKCCAVRLPLRGRSGPQKDPSQEGDPGAFGLELPAPPPADPARGQGPAGGGAGSDGAGPEGGGGVATYLPDPAEIPRATLHRRPPCSLRGASASPSAAEQRFRLPGLRRLPENHGDRPGCGVGARTTELCRAGGLRAGAGLPGRNGVRGELRLRQPAGDEP